MRFLRLSFVATFLFLVLRPALAQTPLRNMPGPQGGMIVYGTVDGANTPPAAMGSILQHLHQQYNDRPVVGRVFKVRGTDSVAVFFTLTRKPSTQKIAGMLIVSNAPGHVEAALLSDEAARFGTSINPMMEKLFATWKPGGKVLASAPASGGRSGGGSEGPSAPAAPLRPFRLPDNSATMMLADGWRVSPQSGGGTILAQGPHGETVALGFPYLAHNSNDPRTAQATRFGQSAAGRNTIYAKNLVAPYGAELGRTFTELNAQAQRVGSPAVASVQLEQAQPVRSSYGGARCAILSGTSSGSGGQQKVEGTFCQSGMDGSGGFMNLANLAFVPSELASRERATVLAMLGSFQANSAVVNAQAYALAKPTIDAVHEIGRQVNERIKESDRQMDERRTSFEQHNDVMDRTSQGFSNYMLDKSVILDNQTNKHGTAWNDTAAAIVQSNPQRYEYVDTPNYWKGVDY
jgi:hypothetical protein